IGSGVAVMYLSWQAGFVILAAIFFLCLLGFYVFAPRAAASGFPARFDFAGFMLLFVGLTTILLALAKASTWGVFFANSQAPFSIYNLSPCLFFVLAGFAVLFSFSRRESMRERKYGKDAVLLRGVLLMNPGVRAGLFMTGFYYYLAMGAAFVLVLYLQIVLKYNAVISGAIFAVVSVGMIGGSLFTPKFGQNFSLRGISLAGIGLSVASTILIVMAIGPDGFSFWLYIGALFLGVGSGMVTAEAPCAVTTAIEDAFHDKQLAGQSSGAQGAARNIGQAIGLALAGLVLVVGLTTFTKTEILKNRSFPPAVDDLSRMVDSMAFVVDDDVRSFLKKKNIEGQYVEAIVADYNKGRIFSVRASLMLLAVGGALFLFPAMNLTTRKLKDLRG
ncbi:MFS transporter, partial [Desulfolutivibrio sp.]|uniref:MFS transporter n=1 Tax=Desulfolutivibrio sp. TaxID=2773296 RepID=UPI002F96747D